jgi:hypothetical protein
LAGGVALAGAGEGAEDSVALVADLLAVAARVGDGKVSLFFLMKLHRMCRLVIAVVIFLPMQVSALSVTHGEIFVLPVSQGSIPLGAQRIEMLKLDIFASCDSDLTVRSITLTHKGKGDLQDIARVYALSNGQRISRARGFSGRDPKLLLELRRFTVPACKTRTVSIAADFAVDAASSGEHQLVFDIANDVDADGVLMFPDWEAEGPLRRIAPKAEGTVSVEYLSITTPVSYGSRRIVSRIRLKADNTRDVAVRSVMLLNRGSARNTDLQNLYLETSRGTARTETVESLDNRTVTLVFTEPLVVERRAEVVLHLRADVRGRSNRTMRFEVEEPGDIQLEAVNARRSNN